MSINAKKRYIDSKTNKINISVLKKDAELLPQRHRDWKSFKASFENKNHYNYEFYGYKIHIDVNYAFKHFTQNTYNEHRNNINATILPVLHNPLIVIKDTYENMPSLTFYKPFLNEENNLLHIMMYKAVLEENGTYKFRTIYEAHSIKKVDEVIKTLDLNTIYFKFD